LKEEKDISQIWYAIYTLPRAEKKVFERISEVGVEAYLPLISTIKIWSDRKKVQILPLIPSYVFVNTNEIKLQELLKIQGVVGILKYLKKPAKIKAVEIDNLKILLNDIDNTSLLDENVAFEKGDKVIVVKGPFKGLIGNFCNLKGKHRMIVNLETVNHFFEVNVPTSFLEKIV
jgi:transcription antitermination factor NusG